MRVALACRAALVACLVVTAPLSAQQPAPAPTPTQAQPAPPPPGYGYGQPPPGYGYPPPGYGYPPPGYGYPPPGYAPAPAKEPPRELPYEEGQSTPPGYHYAERPRTGLIIAGSLVLGIPYLLGLYGAAAADFDNGSAWLAVPMAGPFLMIAARDDECNDDEDSVSDGFECVGEIYLTMVLILDGLAQTAGGIMLFFGATSPKKRWVRNDVSLTVGPTRVGASGYGLGALGTF